MRAWMFYNTNVYFVSQSDFRQTVNLKCVENKYKILIINTFGTLILNAFQKMMFFDKWYFLKIENIHKSLK